MYRSKVAVPDKTRILCLTETSGGEGRASMSYDDDADAAAAAAVCLFTYLERQPTLRICPRPALSQHVPAKRCTRTLVSINLLVLVGVKLVTWNEHSANPSHFSSMQVRGALFLAF